jgi:hypothetical protein
MTANGILTQNQKINGLNRDLDYLLLDFFEKVSSLTPGPEGQSDNLHRNVY